MNKIKCSVCNSNLENPESLIAGIGPVCYQKILFAEILTSDELETMEKKRVKYDPKLLHKLLIFKRKSKVTLGIPFNSDNNFVYFFNRKKIKNVNSDNIVDSYLNAFESIKKEDIEYVSDIGNSSSPDIRRAFKYFKKKISDEIASLVSISKDYNDKGLNTINFNSISNKEKMTSSQILNRESFLKMRETNPEIYSFYWKNGIYQRSTLLYRLQNIEYKEAKDFYIFLTDKKNSQFLELQTKDYGLTNDEIYNGLRNSNQKTEANLFKAFIRGNPNFNLMLKIAKNYKKLNNENKIKVYKFFVKLSNTHRKYSVEDLKEILR
jgi:hypothetical protein